MHRDAAGKAIVTPIMNLLDISHHTGAQFVVFPLQIRELIKRLRLARAVQAMYKQVPALEASRCQGNGMQTRRKVRKEKIEKTVSTFMLW